MQNSTFIDLNINHGYGYICQKLCYDDNLRRTECLIYERYLIEKIVGILLSLILIHYVIGKIGKKYTLSIILSNIYLTILFVFPNNYTQYEYVRFFNLTIDTINVYYINYIISWVFIMFWLTT